LFVFDEPGQQRGPPDKFTSPERYRRELPRTRNLAIHNIADMGLRAAENLRDLAKR
jgi:hypothetical protein